MTIDGFPNASRHRFSFIRRRTQLNAKGNAGIFKKEQRTPVSSPKEVHG
jgi:hypothetical protein